MPHNRRHRVNLLTKNVAFVHFHVRCVLVIYIVTIADPELLQTVRDRLDRSCELIEELVFF